MQVQPIQVQNTQAEPASRIFRAKATVRGISLSLLALLVFGLLPSVQAATVCDTNPITNTAGDERYPQLNSNYIVWFGNDGSDNEIYLYNLATKVTTPMTNNSGDDSYPQISDTHVVWQGSSDGDNEVFLYEIATGETTPLTDNEGISDRDVQIFGNIVVYRSDDGSDSIINMYNIATEQTIPLSNAADSTDNRDAQTNGSFVAWDGSDDDTPNDREVFLYNVATQTTTQLTDNTTNDLFPYLSEDYLTFRGNDGDFEIYYYALSGSGPFPITDNSTYDDNPHVSGQNIVWYGDGGSDYDIYLYNILTQQTTPLTNNNALDFEAQIRGNSVVYRSNIDGDSEIYLYDIATQQYAGPFSDNAMIDTDVQVYGQTVVWVSQESGNFDIHLRVCGEAPAITDQPDSVTITTGTSTTLSVTATGSATLAYQWYEGASGVETTPIVDATEASYTTPVLTGTADYWVKVTNGFGSENSTTATVTVIDAVELLVNTDFETDDNADNIPNNWSMVARSSDRMRCNGVKTVSYAGDCAFHFKGTQGENAKLKQVANLSAVNIEANDTLVFSAYVKSGDTKTKAKLKLTLTYADSTTKTHLITINKTTGYQLFTNEVVVTQPVTKAVFMLHNRSVRGNLYIDSASLLHIPAEDTLVPLPPAAPMRQSS